MTTDNFNELKQLFDSSAKEIKSHLTNCQKDNIQFSIPPHPPALEEKWATALALIQILDGRSLAFAKSVFELASDFLDGIHKVDARSVQSVLEVG